MVGNEKKLFTSKKY